MSNHFDGLQALSTRERLVLGAVGGLIVGAATYPAVASGYVDLFLRPDAAEWTGFGIRIVVAAALGGLWSYIHRPEHSPQRALQLGIVAPAAIAGLIYANDPAGAANSATTAPAPRAEGEILPAPGFSVIGSAHAAGPLDVPVVVPTADPRPVVDRIVKGLFGR